MHKDHFRRRTNSPRGLKHEDSGGGGEKWFNSRYALNIELTELVNKSDVECEIKKSLE